LYIDVYKDYMKWINNSKVKLVLLWSIFFLCLFLTPICALATTTKKVHIESVKKVSTICGGQDGILYNGYLFRCKSNGTCSIYNSRYELIQEIRLNKNNILTPHSNSVCFGSISYSIDDDFPLLYCNIYNNYKNENDSKPGMCCVYRIIKENKHFSCELVQVIKIDFTNDNEIWSTGEDVRPYGNFIIDTDSNTLIVYTMRDKTDTTRFFRFEVPSLNSGEYDDSLGCNVVMLSKEEILGYFDIPYSYYIQGVCYYENNLLLLEGFENSGKLKIVDLNTEKVITTYNIGDVFAVGEPEMIAQENGLFYYSDAYGNLFSFSLSEKHKWNDEVIIKEPTFSEAGLKKYTCFICGETKKEEIPILERKSIETFSVSGIIDRKYTGSLIEQNPTISYDGIKLKKDIDYTVSYMNNEKPGIATVVITGIGEYKDTIFKKFIIVPPSTKITKVQVKKKKSKIYWKKSTYGTGYEIQYRIKGNNKIYKVIITKKKNCSITTSLKRKKKYEFRIRVYTKVGQRIIYSKWSKIKKINIE